MRRHLGFPIMAMTVGLALPLLLAATPAAALTAKQKMETCKIGAKAQELTGAKRNAFIKKCMAKAPARRQSAKQKAKQKMETCKIGASAQDLTGAKRNTFIRKCMAKGNYVPAARRAMKENAMKKQDKK